MQLLCLQDHMCYFSKYTAFFRTPITAAVSYLDWCKNLGDISYCRMRLAA